MNGPDAANCCVGTDRDGTTKCVAQKLTDRAKCERCSRKIKNFHDMTLVWQPAEGHCDILLPGDPSAENCCDSSQKENPKRNADLCVNQRLTSREKCERCSGKIPGFPETRLVLTF